MSLDASGFEEGQRRVWTTGDYSEVARTLAGVTGR
jgi:hypothetical protein